MASARCALAIAFAFVASVSSATDMAAQQRDSARVLPLRELVVSATRAETELANVPVNMTVITHDDLTRSAAQNLEDVLMEIPGLGFQRNVVSASAHPSWQAVSLRGLGGTAASRTLVLVDGVPLNDGYFGWVRWNEIPIETIERIEIVRGGGSTVWGAQSLAGVIHIITRTPRSAGLSVGAQGGDQSTFRGDAMATFGSNRVGGFVAAEALNTDGYTLTTPSQRGAVDVPSSSDHVALRGKVSIDASETVRFIATGSYFDQDKINATRLRPNSTEAGFGQVGLRIGKPGGSRLAINAFGQGQTYQNAISSVAEGRDSESPALSQFDIPSHAFGGNLLFSPATLGPHLLTTGVDLETIHGEAYEDFLFRDGAFQNRRHTGGDQFLAGFFLQDIIHASDRVELVGGARLDVWHNTSGFREVSAIATGDVDVDTDFANRTEVRLSHNIGVRVRASDRVSLRGSVYTGLRVPVLNELYKPFRAAGGIVTESNAGLDPERLLGIEAGLDYQLSRTWLARVTGFWNRVTDAILDATILEVETSQVVEPCGFVPAGGACRQRQNLGTIRSAGVETELEFRPAPAWLIGASLDVTPS